MQNWDSTNVLLSLVVTDGAQSVYKRTSGPPAKQYVQQIYSFSCCGVSGVSLALLSACQFLVCVNISLCILASAFVEVHIVSCFIQLRRWQWTWEKHTLNYYSTQKSGLRWAIFVLKQFFNTLFWLNLTADCRVMPSVHYSAEPIFFSALSKTLIQWQCGISWTLVQRGRKCRQEYLTLSNSSYVNSELLLQANVG